MKAATDRWKKVALATTLSIPVAFAFWSSLPDATKIETLNVIRSLTANILPAESPPATVYETHDIDILFLIDGTTSMLPFIKGAFDSWGGVIDRSREHGFNAHVGIWVYGTELGLYEAAPLAEDYAEENRVSAWRFQGHSHDCHPDCESAPLLMGLHYVIDAAAWRSVSNRLLVLISDKPDRLNPDAHDILRDAALDSAAAKRIHIGGIILTEQPNLAKQMTALCAGVNHSIAGTCLDGYAKDPKLLIFNVVENYFSKISPHILKE